MKRAVLLAALVVLAFSFADAQDRGAVEITGSGINGRVLHKDIIRQDARVGDYIMVFNGIKLNAPRYLTQIDIDYSKSQYKEITEELLGTSPGSVRALLDQLVEERKLADDVPDGVTEPEEVDFAFIRGKVIEFISDMRDGQQIILIVTANANKDHFDGHYQSPPWNKEIETIPPDQTVFLLTKRINTNRNEIFCMTEDIQVTKTLIRKIIGTPPPPPALPSPPPQPPLTPISMVRINGGSFNMGSPSSEKNRDKNEKRHKVTVSGFYMGKYEVTQKEYEEVMGTNPSNWKGPNLPVEQVSWFDAVEYCNRRSQREGLTAAYTISGSGDNRTVSWNRNANGYRLPTEAEWEYACRAGTIGPFGTGNNITTNQANYNGNNPYDGNAKGTYREKTTAVGSFTANPWGLYDMHGNVWEWCWDWRGDYSSGAQTDPEGAFSGVLMFRVFRGGSWRNDARNVRSASRNNNYPYNRFIYCGFRVVRP